MVSKHKLNNQHMHFHSLVHTLTGLNENMHPRVQFQELLYLIYIGACPSTGKFTANPQSLNEMIHLLTPKPQKNYIDRSSSVIVAKYPKLYSNSKRNFSSNNVTLILRTDFAMESDCWILGGWLRFATLVRRNSITLPHRRTTIASNRPISLSKVGNLPFTQLRRCFSVQF